MVINEKGSSRLSNKLGRLKVSTELGFKLNIDFTRCASQIKVWLIFKIIKLF